MFGFSVAFMRLQPKAGSVGLDSVQRKGKSPTEKVGKKKNYNSRFTVLPQAHCPLEELNLHSTHLSTDSRQKPVADNPGAVGK